MQINIFVWREILRGSNIIMRGPREISVSAVLLGMGAIRGLNPGWSSKFKQEECNVTGIVSLDSFLLLLLLLFFVAASEPYRLMEGGEESERERTRG